MQTDLFGQSFTDPMKAKQIPLFHEPVKIEPPDTRDAVDKKLARKFDEKATAMLPLGPNRRRPTLPERVEQEIRQREIPYVNVDEAKKNLFAATRLKSFHFVVYSPQGDNWLLYCGRASGKFRQDMEQWQQVFGEGYKAVFAMDRAAGIVYRTLSGQTLELPTKG